MAFTALSLPVSLTHIQAQHSSSLSSPSSLPRAATPALWSTSHHSGCVAVNSPASSQWIARYCMLVSQTRTGQRWRSVRSNSGGAAGVTRSDASISLGTAVIPPDVDLAQLESILFQWANGITQTANLPLPFTAQVDKISGGFRLSSMVEGPSGQLESEVDIEVTVSPDSGSGPAMFRAVRVGQEQAPAWEPGLMKALLTTLIQGAKLATKE